MGLRTVTQERGVVMKEKRYFISDAAKELEVESHVLRYWEEELNLDIPRNEMGHRYYREEEMQMLQCIKELKARGFQLKTIKQILTELQEGKGEAAKKFQEIKEGALYEAQEKEAKEEAEEKEENGEGMFSMGQDEVAAARETVDNVVPIHTGIFKEPEKRHDRKMQEFEEIMGRIIGHAMRENSHFLGAEVSDQVSEQVVKEVDYLMRLREEREEKRFQNLDATIRQYQKAKKENVAAKSAFVPAVKKKRKSRFFRKRARRMI